MSLRSKANVAAILRTTGCCGIERVILEGDRKINRKIARDGAEQVTIENRRTLLPALLHLREEGYTLIGLEQTSNSSPIRGYTFPQNSVLVVGNERSGISQQILDILDDVIEIPVYGLPHSYNVATATSIALYEFRSQNP